ncbi:MAG: PIN domain-containing protein [Gammaproteobacteria bacterium RIFCSPLOWO2_02_FULL_42_14]|nr:MAG: PIN domain-containing protein [Gammaproteobacteria bacterium RIFCSPHIGHO2_02_FULL_42_43]OGT53504.1 MAG: PIN domain-containing protein [Gammaproteobacteria bacterium RIFCSPHIGHO2_12_FULL_41_25]OGT61450.1 MAG: PIN domain-containing protein [Gammaproteobacteria bacterium RIFCSPLOWO2_02_FULL_42_14]OGT86486.1 MAG: PIN domain-containing protein [Gammaproteobacteria bacterium RIFCSPLOWO2_12_FULL_42_18]
MERLIVLYDACVLYPAPLRDFLMELALTDLFQAKWSNRIHDEWIRNVLKNRPDLTKDKLIIIRDLMNYHVRDCLVEKYEKIIPKLNLPDKNDRHVLAAAIHSKSSIIVTFNTKDFPDRIVKKYEIKAKNPDDFIVNQCDFTPEILCSVAKNCRSRLKKPKFDVERYLQNLERQQLHNTVKMLKKYSDRI